MSRFRTAVAGREHEGGVHEIARRAHAVLLLDQAGWPGAQGSRGAEQHLAAAAIAVTATAAVFDPILGAIARVDEARPQWEVGDQAVGRMARRQRGARPAAECRAQDGAEFARRDPRPDRLCAARGLPRRSGGRPRGRDNRARDRRHDKLRSLPKVRSFFRPRPDGQAVKMEHIL